MTSIPSAIEASIGQRVELASRVRLPENRSGSERPAARGKAQPERAEAATSEEPRIAPPPNRAVTFRLTEDAERFYIEVVDRNTGEVVRQIPPEQLLKLAEQVGNLLNVSV